MFGKVYKAKQTRVKLTLEEFQKSGDDNDILKDGKTGLVNR